MSVHALYLETPQTQTQFRVMMCGGGILQHMHPVLHPALPSGPRVTPLEGSPQLGLLVMAVAI